MDPLLEMDWNEIEIKEEQEEDEEEEEIEESCFTCQKCDIRFQSESSLEIHLRLHNRDPEYKKCSFCGQLFKPKQLNFHISRCSRRPNSFISNETNLTQQKMQTESRNLQTTVKSLFCYECQNYFPDIQSFQNHQHEKEAETTTQSKHSHNNNYDDINVNSEHDYCIKQEDEGNTIIIPNSVVQCKNYDDTKNVTTKNSEAEMKSVLIQNPPVTFLTPNQIVVNKRNSSQTFNVLRKPFAPMSKNTSIVNNININSASDTKQVLANVLSSMNINLSELRDYFRCYKCNASFYKLFDLIPHFKKCQAQPDDTSKTSKRFKQCIKSTQTPKITTNTKSTLTEQEEEMEKENTNLSFYFELEQISPMEIDPLAFCSPAPEPVEKTQDLNEEISNKNEHSPENSTTSNFKSNLCCFKCGESSFPNFQVLKEHYENSHSIRGSFICQTCGAYCLGSREFNRHLIQHEPVRPILQIDPQNPDSSTSNKFLDKPWKPSLEYLEAIKNDEKEKGNFTCIICNRFLHERDKLYHHALRHIKVKVVKCLFCNFLRENQREINRHMLKKHPENFPGFVCKRCDDEPVFPSDDLLKQHKAEKHSPLKGPFICHFCGLTLVSSWTLNEHLRCHEGIRPFKCSFPNCNKSYPSKSRLSQHEKKGHSKRYKCPEEGCGQAFYKNNFLTYHKNEVHLGITPFKCNYPNCDESFSSAVKRAQHLKVHQNRRFKCEAEGCEAIFKHRVSLQRHELHKHTEGVEKLSCTYPDCDYKGTIFLLRNHVQNVHTKKVVRFLCNECGFGCSLKAKYKNHLLVHSDLRPFKCDFGSCERAFKTRATLRIHKIHHSDERPIKCQFCDKSFKQSCVLLRHELTHTKFKPYKCLFCEMAYPDNRSLKHHVAKEHTEQQEFNLNIPSTYQVYLRKSKKKHYSHDANYNSNSTSNIS